MTEKSLSNQIETIRARVNSLQDRVSDLEALASPEPEVCHCYRGEGGKSPCEDCGHQWKKHKSYAKGYVPKSSPVAHTGEGDKYTPLAFNDCQCLCHKGEHISHMVACCSPETPPQSEGEGLSERDRWFYNCGRIDGALPSHLDATHHVKDAPPPSPEPDGTLLTIAYMKGGADARDEVRRLEAELDTAYGRMEYMLSVIQMVVPANDAKWPFVIGRYFDSEGKAIRNTQENEVAKGCIWTKYSQYHLPWLSSCCQHSYRSKPTFCLGCGEKIIPPTQEVDK